MELRAKSLSEKIIGAAIEVHRHLGPGLLESAYEVCLEHEFRSLRLDYLRQKPLPLTYKGCLLESAYRLDFVVDGTVLVELKSVAGLEPIHEAQMLTYLRLSGLPVGLLINFNVPLLRHGIKRFINADSNSSVLSAPPR